MTEKIWLGYNKTVWINKRRIKPGTFERYSYPNQSGVRFHRINGDTATYFPEETDQIEIEHTVGISDTTDYTQSTINNPDEKHLPAADMTNLLAINLMRSPNQRRILNRRISRN